MARSVDRIAVFGMLDVYHEPGSYTFKVVLNKELFYDDYFVDVKMLDPRGQPMEIDVKRWGRKVNCTFELRNPLDEGVCLVRILTKTHSGAEHVDNVKCWVIR